MHMVGIPALIIALLDALVGTIVFTQGGQWERILQLSNVISAVDVSDLWLVSGSLPHLPFKRADKHT